MLGDPEEKGPLTLFLTAPQAFFQKASRVGQKRHFWPSKSWGAVKKRMRGPFSSGSPRPNAELDFDVGFFWNLSVGPSYAAFRTGRWRPTHQNWVRVNPKKAKNSHFLKKMNTPFGSEIWCRLWFCYQTWPSSMISPTYGRSKMTSKMVKKAVL